MMTKKKALLLSVCAMLLIAVAVVGTLAFLTDRDSVTNTFTVGDVQIELDESDVKTDGTLDTTARVDGNEYHLLPGESYLKDPTVTVLDDSEESYVRMILTVHNASAVQAIIDNEKNGLTDFADLLGGWDPTVWLYEGFATDATANTISFEFRYKETVSGENGDNELESLFTSIEVPETLNGTELKSLLGPDGEVGTNDDFKMTITAHAIQTIGFDGDEDAAWAAFDKQVNVEAGA